MSLPLKWEFPGGKLEILESEIDCITREIMEAEHKEFKLLDKLELLNLDWAEADLPIVEEFLKLKL